MSSSDPSMYDEKPSGHNGRWGFGRLFGRGSAANDANQEQPRTSKWSMGVLNDPDTVEVPGKMSPK